MTPTSDPLVLSIPHGARLAWERIRPHVRQTPVEFSAALSQLTGARVYLKLENYQVTGSFKARGALAKLLALSPDEARKGIITASSGNHGAAVAYGLSRLGLKGTVYVPENASPAKVENIRNWGAEVKFHGLDSGLTEVHARAVAEKEGKPYVSPYNDPDVVYGQGTIGLELLEQLEPIDALVAAVGGGGLIAGTAAVLRARFPKVEIVGASPRHSCAMAESIRRGEVVDFESLPTLSDGSAGAIEKGCVTFGACRELIDRFVLVDEEAIRAAMHFLITRHHFLVEGSAGVPVAALLQEPKRFAGRTVVLVLCGANLDEKTLKHVLGYAP